MPRNLHPLADIAITEAIGRYREGAGPNEVGRAAAYELLGASLEIREQAERALRMMAARRRIAVNFAAIAAVYQAVDEMRRNRERSARRRAPKVVRVHRARMGRSG